MLVSSSDWAPMISNLQLKPLCSLILKKTINDPDKYQNGLTKIFFRAGMLAALESLRSDRLNALVTIVQKNMRRRMAVKKYQELRRATIKIQTWWRGILARRLVEYIRREVSARRLQSVSRRFVQRLRFLDTRRAIVLFQSRESRIHSTTISYQFFFRRSTGRPSSACVQGKEGWRGGYTAAEFDTWSVRGSLLASFLRF
jgi:myosin-5